MDVRISVIEKRLSKVKRIISIASGKGGVGKSLIASSLALSLSKKGYKIGLLDLDLYGPSSHIILGIKDFSFPEEERGILPHDVSGIKFMSIVYFTEDKPAPLRGMDITNIIIELLAITQWGELDYLIIDMPPGIGDETLDVIHLIKKSEFLVVSIPSTVAIAAVTKLLNILKELKLLIIGILENMKMNESSFVEEKISEINLNYLGSINYDFELEGAIGKPEKILQTKFMKELNILIDKIL
jgi:ATP-binding protein involved in chromosome partitioning